MAIWELVAHFGVRGPVTLHPPPAASPRWVPRGHKGTQPWLLMQGGAVGWWGALPAPPQPQPLCVPGDSFPARIHFKAFGLAEEVGSPSPSKALPFPLIFKELKAFTLGKRKKRREKRKPTRKKVPSTY